MSRKLTIDELLIKFNNKHNFEYNYDDFVYIDDKTKGKIFCRKHGYFWQTSKSHGNSGSKCPDCASKNRSISNTIPIEIIRKELHILYPTFIFNTDNYVNKNSKLQYTCGEGHSSKRSVYGLLNEKLGCSKCKVKNKVTKTTQCFINECKEIFQELDSFDKTIYNRSNKKVIITCNIHGDYLQTPNNYLNGHRCKKCGNKKISIARTKSMGIKRKEFNILHNFKYTYDNSIYVNNITPIEITCSKHGIFTQKPVTHQQKCGCPYCAAEMTVSRPEIELQEFIKTIYEDVKVNNRSIIKPYELDIYIPELKKAIEFNGLYWHYHTHHFVPGKHAQKSNLCKELGIKLLHIREDLWLRDKNKMKEIILKFLEY